jgi:hypothetical protein
MDDLTAMEARTSAALHVVADGLLVSEGDLDRMEGELMTLLETRPPGRGTTRRSRWELGVAAAAVAALAVGGTALWRASHEEAPATPAPAPSQPLVPPELVGLWQVQPDSPWLWEFGADGRVMNVDTAAGYLAGGESAGRIIRRDGDRFTLDEAGASPTVAAACAGLRIRVVAPGVASLTEDCGAAPLDLRLEKVSPHRPVDPPITPRFPDTVARQVTTVSQLEGSWADQATGLVLVVATQSGDGEPTYLVDGDGDGSVRPDQRGVLTVGTDGSVRPRPAASPSGGCAPVFTKVVTTTAVLTTTSGPGGCYPDGSTQSWIRLN